MIFIGSRGLQISGPPAVRWTPEAGLPPAIWMDMDGVSFLQHNAIGAAGSDGLLTAYSIKPSVFGEVSRLCASRACFTQSNCR